MWKNLALVCLVGSFLTISIPLADAQVVETQTPLGTLALTPESIVSMQRVRDVAVSPQGDLIAYTLQVPRDLDEKRGAAYTEIWVVGPKGENPRRFTPERQRAWAPAFSPDGSMLAFLSDRRSADDKDAASTNDLFLIDLRGGEARELTDSQRSVSDFRWSPNGDAIAFLARQPRSKEEKEAREKGRDWTEGDRELRPRLLWSVEVQSGEVRQLTEENIHVWDFDWSPNGSDLLLQVSDSPRADEWYLWSRLALVSTSGGEPVELVRTQGKLQGPRFAPDGRHVAWLGATDLNDPFPGTLFVAPVSGGEARPLTTNEPGTATWFDWMDDSSLLYAATRGTATTLVNLSLTNSSQHDVLAEGPVFTRFNLSANRKTIVLIGSTPLHPDEVFTAPLSGRQVRLSRVTVTNPEIEKAQLGTQEVVRWKAEDGLEIEGVVVRPATFSPGVRYPLVVQVHGGPESCYRNGWNTSYGRWTQLLVQRGFIVLAPNYRGSTGRGEEFERADHEDMAGAEFRDVLAGIDALVELGWVDPNRVGIGGGSYGGYFSAWAATAHSERFAAAVVFAGITDWHSMQGVSDIPQENAYVHWNLPYYDHFDLYWERSPLAHVKNCRTPVLIAHGDNDQRVPVGQGVELYTALRLLGQEVELVRYPRAGHGLSEVAQQLDYMTRSLAWFERHLKPSTQAVYR